MIFTYTYLIITYTYTLTHTYADAHILILLVHTKFVVFGPKLFRATSNRRITKINENNFRLTV